METIAAILSIGFVLWVLNRIWNGAAEITENLRGTHIENHVTETVESLKTTKRQGRNQKVNQSSHY